MLQESYLPAKEFFAQAGHTALTFDDVSLATRYSEVLPKDADISTQLSENVTLKLPMVSSDMDTVTEAKMATAMALAGGIGLIHYNLPGDMQRREVARVKNHVHGLIAEPITVQPTQLIGDVLALIAEKGYGFRTFPVTEADGTLVGLLSGHTVKERYASVSVAKAMTPRADVRTLLATQLETDPASIIAKADAFFSSNIGIHKLLVVDADEKLKGLFTLSDIERIAKEASADLKPARDDAFRLLCGAAIGMQRTQTGALNKDAILAHVHSLVTEGLNVAAISSAHAHTASMGEMVALLRAEFPALTLIAGNVTSAQGVEFLADAGANCIKVGQGGGSICTTRMVAGVGIPQLTALHVAAQAAAKKGVRILADGGITKSGDIVKALTVANAVMCGSLLAGCPEAPGNIMEIEGKFYKEYRGMGSKAAMRAGSAARYGHSVKSATSAGAKVAAEGIEALKEVSGSLADTVRELAGGLQAGMGYLGARNLTELKANARYVRVTTAGAKESAPHDVVEVRTKS